MRSDMAKVIVERPRWGHRDGHIETGRCRPLLDDEGVLVGFRARDDTRAKKTKRLNENLSPLRRYLAAQVGRPWDRVYGDIAAHLRVGSTVQQHVRDHLTDFVAVKTFIVDGVVWTALCGRRGGFRGPSRSKTCTYGSMSIRSRAYCLATRRTTEPRPAKPGEAKAGQSRQGCHAFIPEAWRCVAFKVCGLSSE